VNVALVKGGGLTTLADESWFICTKEIVKGYDKVIFLQCSQYHKLSLHRK